MSESAAEPAGTPTWAQFSRAMNALVTERDGEWCGLPMPLPGLALTLEDRHPGAARIAELQRIVDADLPPADGTRACSEEDLGLTLVNSWYSHARGGAVLVIRKGDGATTWGLDADKPKRNRMLMGPFETLDAWDLDVELTAIDRLATLLSERMFKSYVLGGAFLETSQRSGLTYWFRRCRPTIVLTPHGDRHAYFAATPDDGQMRLLCALCLHPIGYYAGTYMGAMVPTDDVIAHLTMMRADEAMYWRRANQHPVWAPEAGVY